MEYLKDKQHYIDRYDLVTIENCLEMLDVHTHAYVETLKNIGTDEHSKAEMAHAASWLTNQQLFVIKANRYVAKEETIQKWMDQDQIKQEKYDNTPEPRNIRCPNCKKLMLSRLKQLEAYDDPIRMMFLFECSSCKKRRWIYEDGTEFDHKILCPKCKAELEVSLIKESKKEVIWKKTCSSCGFSKTEVDDFDNMKAETKKFQDENKEKEIREKKILEVYHAEYCSEEKGKEAYEYMEAIKVGNVVFDEELKKYDSLAYQKVSQLKKLSIIELEKLLNELFEKERFIRLSFDNPQMGPQVIVPFNTQDANSSRKETNSIDQLQKIIKNGLEGTNWRLMSDGLSYRLGFISGRLKGYEREEDFFELSGEKKEEESSKIDYETRMKYEGHNVVQLARLMGEHRGIENVRIRRLEKEPEGFFLNEDEGPYTCAICGENHDGNKSWWNLDGLRCADCWRNIKVGVIPPLKSRYEDDVYFGNWQLSSDNDFDIHSSTVRKLRRQGLLHGRDLKREDGTIYCTVYLIEDNKEFLEKYPRKPRKGRIITDLLGNKLEL